MTKANSVSRATTFAPSLETSMPSPAAAETNIVRLSDWTAERHDTVLRLFCDGENFGKFQKQSKGSAP